MAHNSTTHYETFATRGRAKKWMGRFVLVCLFDEIIQIEMIKFLRKINFILATFTVCAYGMKIAFRE
jgi:hypothetical protein